MVKITVELSSRAISVARAVDRLPPGEYTIKINKPDPAQPWAVEICKVQSVQSLELPKREANNG